MCIIVKDKQDVEWFSKMNPDQFKMQKDDYGVQVYDHEGKPAKKYLKGFLKYVSEFTLKLNDQEIPVTTVKKITLPKVSSSFFPDDIPDEEEIVDLIPEPIEVNADDESPDEPEIAGDVNAPDDPELPEPKIDEESQHYHA
jgi:hypothetical protein